MIPNSSVWCRFQWVVRVLSALSLTRLTELSGRLKTNPFVMVNEATLLDAAVKWHPGLFLVLRLVALGLVSLLCSLRTLVILCVALLVESMACMFDFNVVETLSVSSGKRA